jgi:hypothetical protein
MPKRSRFDPDTFSAWRRRYEAGQSTKQIAVCFGVGGGTVYDRLKTMRVAFRSPSVSKRFYLVNEGAFSRIGTEETAYWLGFLYADGSVWGSRYVALWLKEKDAGHVERFRRFLGSGHPIRFDLKRKAAGITVASKRLSDALVEQGCTPRKSLKLSFPVLLPELESHFIRGYFDGDGSAYLGSGAPTISFVGNMDFLAAIQARINAGISGNGSLRPHCRSAAWYLIYRGEFQVPVVRDWRYRAATVWLSRKRERLDGYAPGKRKGYPTAGRYQIASTAGNVSADTLRRYIEAQKGI